MFGDPDFFDIPTLKQMDLWPSEKMVSKELAPYIRRMRSINVKILEVGIKKGENAVDLFDRCDNIKIFYGIEPNEKYKDLLSKNVAVLENKFKLKDETNKKDYDVIIFDSDANLEVVFEKYYKNLRTGGIICGNDHNKTHVKAALLQFKRKNKISAPLHIATGTVWFWFKP